MALSGSSSVVRLGTTGCEAKFDWIATQNGNRSTVTVTLSARRWSSGGWFTGGWNKAVITIGGKKSAIITIPGVAKGSNTEWIAQTSSTQVLKHGTEGSLKSLISVRVYQTASTRFSHTIDQNITVTPVSFTPSPTQPTPGTPLPTPSVYWSGKSTHFYLFDKEEDLIAVVPRSQIREATMTEEINEPRLLDVTLTPKVDISAAVYIGHKYLAETALMAYYKVTNVISTGETIRIIGVESGYDDLQARRIMYAGIDEDKLMSSWLATDILSQTGWSVGNVTDDKLTYLDYYAITPLEGLQLLMDIVRYEFRFRIAFDGSAITSKVVDVAPQFGSDRGKRFVHGSNLLKIVRDDNRNDIATAIFPIGWHDTLISNVIWTKPTNPVNKPDTQYWIEDPTLTAAFGYPGGGKRIKVVYYDKIEDANELIQRAYDDILVMGRPQIAYQTTVRDVGDTGLGDTVSIIRDDIGIRYKTRIYKRIVNLIDQNQVTIELGDKERRDVSSQIAAMKRRVDEIAKRTRPVY